MSRFSLEGSHIRPRRTRLGRGGQKVMWYVYILYSQKLEKKYIGFTKNLKNRLDEHNSGKSNFTSKGGKWKLIYYEVFLSEKDAREEEIFLKNGKGRERLKILLKNTFGSVA